MASFHFSAKAVSRSTGRSAVGAAAYRSGERLTNERDGVTHDYTRKRGVLSSFIVAPAGAEAWASDRGGLWNRAEAAEARKDAKVAREYELALPAELSAPEREALARQFAQAVVERFGVVADVALHAPHREGDQRNWHAHILTTTRVANENGLGVKTRVLDSPKASMAEIEALRELWAKQVNAALERAQVEERVDHRSHKRRYLDRTPTVHLGPAVTALERQGTETTRGEENRAIIALETAITQAREASRQAEAVVIDLQAEREKRKLERARLAGAVDRSSQVHPPIAHFERHGGGLERQGLKTMRGDEDRAVAALNGEISYASQENRKQAQLVNLEAERARAEQERLAALERHQLLRQQERMLEAAMKAQKAARALLDQAEATIKAQTEAAARWREAHPLRTWMHKWIWRATPLDEATARAVEVQQELGPLREQAAKATAAVDAAREQTANLLRVLPGGNRERTPERERDGRDGPER